MLNSAVKTVTLLLSSVTPEGVANEHATSPKGPDRVNAQMLEVLAPSTSRSYLRSAIAAAASNQVTAPTNAAARRAVESPKALDLASPQVAEVLNTINRKDPSTADAIPSEYLKDRGFVQAAARKMPSVLLKASKALQNDTEFIADILVEKGPNFVELHEGILDYVQEKHFDNDAFVKSLLKQRVSAYKHASLRLRSSEEILDLAITSRCSILLGKVPEVFRHDREKLSTILKDGEVYVGEVQSLSGLIPEQFLGDKELWLNAAGRNNLLFPLLPSQLLHDRAFAKAAVTKSPFVYSCFPEEVQADKELATLVYRSSHSFVKDIPSKLYNDQPFMVSLLHYNGAGFDKLPEDARKSPALIAAAAETNAAILARVDPTVLLGNTKLLSELATRSYNTRAPLMKLLGELPQEVEKIYDNTEMALKLLGFSEHTYKPEWFAGAQLDGQVGRFDATQEVIRNRFSVAPKEIQQELRRLLGDGYFGDLSASKDKRPKVVIILPHADDRHALAQSGDRLLPSDFIDQATRENRVILYEVSTKDELIKARMEHKKIESADDLVLAAHGFELGMSFGGLDPGENRFEPGDPRFLTIHDTQALRDLGGWVKDGGRVILLSCKTGKSTEDGPNIADAIHGVFSHATVIAPAAQTSVVSIVDPITGHITPPSYSNALRRVDSYVLSAKERIPFEVEGLDPDTARAVGHILRGTTYPLSFTGPNRESPGAVEMLRYGRPDGALMVYDPEVMKAVPLSGTKLSLAAADLVVREIVSSVLMDKKMDRLWANWSIKKGEDGFIGPNDPLLKRAKQLIASALNVDQSSVVVYLHQVPGGRTATITLGSKQTPVVRIQAISLPNGFKLHGKPEVDLNTIGREMRR